jgi:CBS domain-containing protein
MTVSVERLLALRRDLAAARANALQDAEGISALLVAIEDVGAIYNPNGHDSLEKYCSGLSNNLMDGPGQQDFQKLFKVVTWNRNTGVHAGAWARHATTNAVELALLLEDALGRKVMQGNKTEGSNGNDDDSDKAKDQSDWRVEHFMVRDPICAQPWHTIADVRRAMLRNSFSYLPIWTATKGGGEVGWKFIADHAVARWLGSPSQKDPRRSRGRTTVKDAINANLSLTDAETLRPSDTWTRAIELTKASPAMVIKDTPDQILGIVTAFDLL